MKIKLKNNEGLIIEKGKDKQDLFNNTPIFFFVEQLCPRDINDTFGSYQLYLGYTVGGVNYLITNGPQIYASLQRETLDDEWQLVDPTVSFIKDQVGDVTFDSIVSETQVKTIIDALKNEYPNDAFAAIPASIEFRKVTCLVDGDMYVLYINGLHPDDILWIFDVDFDNNGLYEQTVIPTNIPIKYTITF